eukprot:287161-Alexandrium_andersonii.AAC.1
MAPSAVAGVAIHRRPAPSCEAALSRLPPSACVVFRPPPAMPCLRVGRAELRSGCVPVARKSNCHPR